MGKIESLWLAMVHLETVVGLTAQNKTDSWIWISGCMRFTGTPLLNTKVSNVKRYITAEINKDGSDW